MCERTLVRCFVINRILGGGSIICQKTHSLTLFSQASNLAF